MAEQAPRLRTDIEVFPATYEGKRGILVRDTLGLIREPIFLHGDILEFMRLIDGKRERRDIQMEISRGKGGLLVDLEEVDRVLTELDGIFLLDSDHFQQARQALYRQYARLKVRTSALAGRSYPENRDELEAFLQSFFQDGEPVQPELEGKTIQALVAPHIELKAGKKVYGKAYQAVRYLSPKRVILMGTGHALGEGLVSVTEKDFETPLGRVHTDRDFVRELKKKAGTVMAPHDLVHRSEHSLELQLIFLQYLWGSEFTLLPILFGSFQGELKRYKRPLEITGLKDFLETLKRYVLENIRDTLIVAGVDLCHVGPKFGHDQSAAALLAEVRRHDKNIIEAVRDGDVEKLWEITARVEDRYNVCGFSTLACLLEICPHSHGILLGYDIYEEAQTNSAVTFTAMALTET